MSKLSHNALAIVQGEMEKNNETTAGDLQKKLEQSQIPVSERTALRVRTKLGWVYGNTRYCQVRIFIVNSIFCIVTRWKRRDPVRIKFLGLSLASF